MAHKLPHIKKEDPLSSTGQCVLNSISFDSLGVHFLLPEPKVELISEVKEENELRPEVKVENELISEVKEENELLSEIEVENELISEVKEENELTSEVEVENELLSEVKAENEFRSGEVKTDVTGKPLRKVSRPRRDRGRKRAPPNTKRRLDKRRREYRLKKVLENLEDGFIKIKTNNEDRHDAPAHRDYSRSCRGVSSCQPKEQSSADFAQMVQHITKAASETYEKTQNQEPLSENVPNG